MNSQVHVGVVLADSRHASEANAYIQRRLAVFYRVVVGLAGALYIAGALLWGEEMGWRAALFHPGRVVHLGAILAAAAILIMLRRRTLSARALVFYDALGLHISIGAAIAIYAIDYHMAPHSMAAILSLFIIARAVVVPASCRTTTWLSLPAPFGVLAVQLAYGIGYAQDGVPMTETYFRTYVIWNQLVLFLAVGVAALASYITFGLRHQVREAAKLGQYRIEKLIGKGAMGQVFKARHAMLRRPTAIKVITPDTTDPDLLKRFEREVRETARLSHPNTVQIFDYGRTPEGAFYYAMEYLDGADLRQIVTKHGPLPPPRAIHVLTQACGALKEAHGAGLVHRDIKPGNILLCQRGGEHDVVKLVDFGLVKDIASTSASLTQLGQICGTPETIAPEVLGGGKVTPSADIYALGAVGYYILSGSPIFDAKSAADLIGHHLHSPPVPLRERVADVPDDLEAVLMRCLAKKPEERYGSVAELRQALRRCVDSGLWTEKLATQWWSAHTPSTG